MSDASSPPPLIKVRSMIDTALTHYQIIEENIKTVLLLVPQNEEKYLSHEHHLKLLT